MEQYQYYLRFRYSYLIHINNFFVSGDAYSKDMQGSIYDLPKYLRMPRNHSWPQDSKIDNWRNINNMIFDLYHLFETHKPFQYLQDPPS